MILDKPVKTMVELFRSPPLPLVCRTGTFKMSGETWDAVSPEAKDGRSFV